MEKIRILFLAANPYDTSRLALAKEVREIEDRIRSAKYRDRLEVVPKLAVRPRDLLRYLNECQPHVVHCSGHGMANEGIILEDDQGGRKVVAADALRSLFRVFRDKVRLVMLNACYSDTQARAIVEEIDCVIGMNGAIDDSAAIVFASEFYSALAFGDCVQIAFCKGLVALQLESIPQQDIPSLLVRVGVDAAHVALVPERLAPDRSASEDDVVETLFSMARDYLASQDYEDCRRALDQLVLLRPCSAEALWLSQPPRCAPSTA